MLELDVSKTVELFLVTIGDKSEGVEESERRLGTKLVLESLQGCGCRGLFGRSEGGGRGDKGCKNSGLHRDVDFCLVNCEKGFSVGDLFRG